MKFATRAIHAGQEPDPATGAVIPPIYQTAPFAQQGLDEQKRFVYSRVDNPTRHALEVCLASLENGKYGLAFASAMAAESAALGLLSTGDHIVACDDLYGDTYRIFERAMRRYQIETSYVSARNIAEYEQALRPTTRMIWLETPPIRCSAWLISRLWLRLHMAAICCLSSIIRSPVPISSNP